MLNRKRPQPTSSERVVVVADGDLQVLVRPTVLIPMHELTELKEERAMTDPTKTSGQDAQDPDLKDYLDPDEERAKADVKATAMLLRFLVQALVDVPTAVHINTVSGAQSVIFEVSVIKEDVKRVIGRRGRTADAVREILTNLGGKAGRRFLLEIVEPDRRIEEVPVEAAEATIGETEVVGRARIRIDLTPRSQK